MFTCIILQNCCLAHCTHGQRHTFTHTHSNKQESSYSVRPLSSEKGCQMALWEVVSEDEAGEALSVSLCEIIHVHRHLPSHTRQVITAEEEEEAC